jgi:hypothetical protein
MNMKDSRFFFGEESEKIYKRKLQSNRIRRQGELWNKLTVKKENKIDGSRKKLGTISKFLNCKDIDNDKKAHGDYQSNIEKCSSVTSLPHSSSSAEISTSSSTLLSTPLVSYPHPPHDSINDQNLVPKTSLSLEALSAILSPSVSNSDQMSSFSVSIENLIDISTSGINSFHTLCKDSSWWWEHCFE